jgi:hypothetical protein
MHEKGLKLLVNLSFVSEEASQAMVAAGTVAHVLAALARHPTATGVQTKGLWVLKNLAHYKEGSAAVVAAGGAAVAAQSMVANLPVVEVVEQVGRRVVYTPKRAKLDHRRRWLVFGLRLPSLCHEFKILLDQHLFFVMSNRCTGMCCASFCARGRAWACSKT